MITCHTVRDEPEAAYFRQHIRAVWSSCQIDSPRPPPLGTAWVARDSANRCIGAMHVDNDEDGKLLVEMHATEPAALTPLLNCLPSETECQFEVGRNIRDLFLSVVRSAVLQTGPMGPLEFVVFAVSPDTHMWVPQADGVRLLTVADICCARHFPSIPYYSMEPTREIELAADDAESRVYGLVSDDELRAYATCRCAAGSIWEICNICTHPEHRQRGYGKAVLSYVCRDLLDMGLLPRCNIRANNQPSIRTALAVGMTEYDRRYTYTAITPSSGGH